MYNTPMTKSPPKNENPLREWFRSLQSGADKSGKKGKGFKPTHFSIWYFAVVLLIVLAVQEYVLAPAVETISYGTFKQFVANGAVDNLKLSPQWIEGELKPVAGSAETKKETASKEVKRFVTVRVDDPGLIKEFDDRKINYSGLYQSHWLNAILTWGIPILIFFFIWRILFKRLSSQPGIMSIGKNKAKIYAEDEMRVTFEDVAGVDEATQELKEVVQFLQTPERFRRLGGKLPKGVLLVGPPGTGKTLLAKAVAGEAKVPFFSISGSDFVEMFVGVGASRVRDLFAQAETNAPCIIFIDELDALGKARSGIAMGGVDEREQTLNQLLVEMDGFDSKKGVIIMAATNRPEILDPALLRAGRFDRTVLVDRPDINGREAIIRVHIKGVTTGPDVEIRKLAARTPGFVGADLANMINEAALLAARTSKNFVTMEDFDEAIDRIVGGLEKKTRVMNPREKEIVAYHESGHALVAISVPGTDPVHKISIIPRGIAALGYTQQLPTEDRYLMSRSELMARLYVLLGGRVAEELVFGDISTGAQNDLNRATDIIRSMVTEYGMSEKIGLVTFEKERSNPYFPTGDRTKSAYSEETAQAIDREIATIMQAAHDKVTTILSGKKETLDRVARTLLQKEVIEGDELRALVEADAR